MASEQQMRADLRFAGDRVADTWMKKRFQIRASQPIDPSSVCIVANGQLIETNFVPEFNEVRVNPLRLAQLELAAKSGLTTEIIWCENSNTRNNSPFNTFEVNASCKATLERIQAAKQK